MNNWRRDAREGYGKCLVLDEGSVRVILYLDGGEWASSMTVGDAKPIFHGTNLRHVLEMAPGFRDEALELHHDAMVEETARIRKSLAGALSALRHDDPEKCNGLVDELYTYNLERLHRDYADAVTEGASDG